MIWQLKIDFGVLDAAVEICLPGYVRYYGSPDGHGLISFKREERTSASTVYLICDKEDGDMGQVLVRKTGADSSEMQIDGSQSPMSRGFTPEEQAELRALRDDKEARDLKVAELLHRCWDESKDLYKRRKDLHNLIIAAFLDRLRHEDIWPKPSEPQHAAGVARPSSHGEGILTTPEQQSTYDVFVSHSHKDGQWVQDELLPWLKSAGLKVCIDSESYQPGEPFEVGTPLITAIEKAVLASHKTICVFSPAYLGSEWCEQEEILTTTLDPAARKRQLLPILLKPCDLPPRIKGRLYVDFTSVGAHDQAWDKVLAALGGSRVPGTKTTVAALQAHIGQCAGAEGGGKIAADRERIAERYEQEGKGRTRREIIAYRDVIVLRHEITGRFLSSDSINYKHPNTSGQQLVIARVEGDSSDHWVVKGPYGTPEEYRQGSSVRNGDIVRLEHENTSRNLHSHPGYPSPVTHQQEVTAYQVGQIGDASDNWRVQLDSGKCWRKGVRVQLIHQATGRPLHSHQGYILKLDTLEEQEVTCFPGTDDNDLWRVVDINPGTVCESQRAATIL
jgi:hypothetical protein